jgi:hypothetical protein
MTTHHRIKSLATAIALALAIVAPAAAAQPIAFTASYNVKSAGHNGTPACPNDELICGTGTSPQLGAFTYAQLLTSPNGTVEAVLDFGDGNVLALTEAFGDQFVSNPGNSENVNVPFSSFGHPATFGSDWTLDSADTTGTFSSLTGGTGADVLKFAGIAGQGVINGTLT